jgi:hypothetical protein
MKYVNDIAVSDDMYGKILAARQAGSKCFLTIPERLKKDDLSYHRVSEFCVNCNAAGKIGLQVITGGPYEYVPAIEVKGWNEKLQKDDPGPRATVIDDKWWKQKTREYTCPVCHGSGIYVEMPGRAKTLDL